MSLGGEELDLDATWAAYAVTDGATVTVEVPLQHTAQAQAAGPYQAGPIRMNGGVIFDGMSIRIIPEMSMTEPNLCSCSQRAQQGERCARKHF